MIGLFFEVMPRPGHEQAYFDIAAGLQPELDKNPGLLFIDRFKSLSRSGIVLSHSHWRDEASLAAWRTHVKHHAAQVAGRQQHFEDYRLRIGQLVCEWLPNAGDLRRIETTNSYNDPTLQRERFIVVSTANTSVEAGAESEVMVSVSREHEYIALAPIRSLPDGLKAVEHFSLTGAMTSVRLYLVSRDYGMYDRREAPQYYTPMKRSQ
ncbi:MAG: antibiotic biosynthesis monooxygenase [Rhizobiales bacterium]|nr:antibiotic biosynthesis monooxygenase [Hyphomicrobiales bacterium]